jgi:hypothetical protein
VFCGGGGANSYVVHKNYSPQTGTKVKGRFSIEYLSCITESMNSFNLLLCSDYA